MLDAHLSFGLDVARRLTRAGDDEWPVEFERLRRTRQLSYAIRQMNLLLQHPEHADVVSSSLRRIGLWITTVDRL
jgi:hypothetical protein